ncbi:MAG: enoyl-CoA hydratase/isomerase family protein [Promethearchaeota archaeon]
MVNETILLEKKGKIATVILNNPEKLNALDINAFKELNRIFNDLKQDKKIRCVFIRGTGEKAFSAGLDTTMLTSGDPDLKNKILEVGSSFSNLLYNFPKPVISVINGLVVGWGMIISMLTDFRYSIKKTYFKLPELEIGIYPATGALTLCMLHFGLSMGKRILFLSEKIPAEEMARVGFVHGLGETIDDVMGMALSTAKYLTRINQQVLRYSKVNVGLMFGVDFQACLDLEARCFIKLMETSKSKDWYELDLQEFEKLRQWSREKVEKSYLLRITKTSN